MPEPDSAAIHRVDDHVVQRLADEADVAARSVVRRLAGLPVRGRCGARIDKVLAAHGLAPGGAVSNGAGGSPR